VKYKGPGLHKALLQDRGYCYFRNYWNHQARGITSASTEAAWSCAVSLCSFWQPVTQGVNSKKWFTNFKST